MRIDSLFPRVRALTLSGALFAWPLAAAALAQELDAPRPIEPQDISGPGPEHRALATLAGAWRVSTGATGGGDTGEAMARVRLGGRYLEVEMTLDAGPIRHAVYTFGFDRRHDEYLVTAMDDTGTYSVSARGTRDGSRIAMYGVDDDPVMTRMGLTKEFVIVLELTSDDRVTIETRLVDTRTPERNQIAFLAYHLRR